MKKKTVLMAALVLLLAGSFIITGCGGSSLSGTTWVFEFNGFTMLEYEFTSSSTWKASVNLGMDTDSITGTYTVSNNTVTMTDSDGDIQVATIKGNTMTFTDEDGKDWELTKKR